MVIINLSAELGINYFKLHGGLFQCCGSTAVDSFLLRH